MKTFFVRVWKSFVDLCSAWPWLKPILGVLSGVAVSIYGYLEQIPGTYLAVAAILAAGSAMWLCNQLAWRGMMATFSTSTAQATEVQQTTKPIASVQELAQQVIVSRTVQIYNVPRNVDIIDGKVFEDCAIVGPAIIASLEGTLFDLCRFGHPGQFKWLFWETAQDRVVIGVIGLRRCVFRNCNFAGIGLCGTRKVINDMKAKITVTS
jgi:hypothetical protein